LLKEIQNSLFDTLRNALLDDLFKDFDLPGRRWLRGLVEPLARPSVERFAQIAADFDAYVKSFGFQEGMRHILPTFVNGFQVKGEEDVPKEGPLLVISNHPGACDSLLISANLPRNDLSILAYQFPLLQRLPTARNHLIFTANEEGGKLRAARLAIQHLQSGGALLLFPRGRVEPDPAIQPGAIESIQYWSPSLELFLRKVPETRLLISIVSGVLSPGFLRLPFLRLWRGIRDPQAVAEVLQVLIQMIFPGRVHLHPHLSFDSPLALADLSLDQTPYAILELVSERARELLRQHTSWIEEPPAYA
jgi:hypothetical protein